MFFSCSAPFETPGGSGKFRVRVTWGVGDTGPGPPWLAAALGILKDGKEPPLAENKQVCFLSPAIGKGPFQKEGVERGSVSPPGTSWELLAPRGLWGASNTPKLQILHLGNRPCGKSRGRGSGIPGSRVSGTVKFFSSSFN